MPYRTGDERAPSRRRGLQECLACHAVVLPSADGECPACRKKVDEARDDGRRAVTVRHDSDLPDVCARCGGSTKRRVALQRSRNDPKVAGHSIAFRILVLLIWPIALIFTRSNKRDRIALKLPLCSGCEAVPPDHVDFERRELTLVVHRNLHSALLER